MKDEQLLRYSRHLLLPQLDVAGQEKLLAASVLVVGVGGLGSPVVIYLAAGGVGKLLLNDFDEVDISNLQRQVAHDTDSVGQLKTSSAKNCLQRLNPDCQAIEISERLDEAGLRQQLGQVDAVVDCSDNFATRYLLNRLCYEFKTPLVSGAAIRFEGQLTTFIYDGASPCYACLYPDTGEGEEESCSESGVLSPLVGTIGALQATEVIKLLADLGEPLNGHLLCYDALKQDFQKIKFKQDPACTVCGRTG